VHDYNLFSQIDRLDNLRRYLAKSTTDKRLQDVGENFEEFRTFWAVLMDKAYIGAEQRVRAIIPKKIQQQQQKGVSQ